MILLQTRFPPDPKPPPQRQFAVVPRSPSPDSSSSTEESVKAPTPEVKTPSRRSSSSHSSSSDDFQDINSDQVFTKNLELKINIDHRSNEQKSQPVTLQLPKVDHPNCGTLFLFNEKNPLPSRNNHCWNITLIIKVQRRVRVWLEIERRRKRMKGVIC